MNKIHAMGTRTIGSERLTACNNFLAEGRWKIGSEVTEDPDKVTCKACLKALAKTTVPFHRHEDLLVEFPKVGGCGHHEHDGYLRHYHYASGDRIDWRDNSGKDHSTGWVKE